MEIEKQQYQYRNKSFAIRAGRMTAGQKKGWEQAWHQFGINLPETKLNLKKIYKHDAPVVLEIGFGMGDSLLAMAMENPRLNYLGIEVHRPGVGALLNKLQQQNVSNVRILCHDAVEVLERHIENEVFERVQIYFPDPWCKRKHHKRRLIQPDFINLLLPKIELGGHLHLATDWHDYAQQMLDVLSANEGLENCASTGTFIERPPYRHVTKFENRGHQLGHDVWDLLFCRK